MNRNQHTTVHNLVPSITVFSNVSRKKLRKNAHVRLLSNLFATEHNHLRTVTYCAIFFGNSAKVLIRFTSASTVPNPYAA